MPKALPMRIVAGLALLVSLVVNFGVIDLATAVAPSAEWEPVRMVEAGWGIVFGVLYPVGFAGCSPSAARWTARSRRWQPSP